MPSPTIRPARSDEYDEVARVWMNSWTSTGLEEKSNFLLAKLRARIPLELANGWGLFVADDGGTLAAMLACLWKSPRAPRASMPASNDAVPQDESPHAVPLGNKWTMMAYQSLLATPPLPAIPQFRFLYRSEDWGFALRPLALRLPVVEALFLIEQHIFRRLDPGTKPWTERPEDEERDDNEAQGDDGCCEHHGTPAAADCRPS
jgi:hypothetical protein